MQVFILIGGGLITAFAAITVIVENIPSIDGALSALGHIKDYLAQDVADRHFNLVVSRNPEAFPPILNDPYFRRDCRGNLAHKPKRLGMRQLLIRGDILLCDHASRIVDLPKIKRKRQGRRHQIHGN